jgi:signal transduction histidine kinase
VNSIKTINAVIGKIGFHESGRDKKIILLGDAYDTDFETDNSLLQRVLINLVKNALEATSENGTVTLGAENLHKMIRFRVKNEGVIPRDVQLQLFQRSFTTRGIGRGLGTYSIKLLTENYLKGHVSFISNEAEGTIFRVDLNKVFH